MFCSGHLLELNYIFSMHHEFYKITWVNPQLFTNSDYKELGYRRENIRRTVKDDFYLTTSI